MFLLIRNISVMKSESKKIRTQHSHLPLRDGITTDMFEKLMFRAGHNEKVQRRLSIQIVYILLYYGGWRINEIRLLTKEQIFELIQTREDKRTTNKRKFKSC